MLDSPPSVLLYGRRVNALLRYEGLRPECETAASGSLQGAFFSLEVRPKRRSRSALDQNSLRRFVFFVHRISLVRAAVSL